MVEGQLRRTLGPLMLWGPGVGYVVTAVKGSKAETSQESNRA